MSREAQFIEAILVNPDDESLRLVYADWLEEQGSAAQAEFIRIQHELRNHFDDTRWEEFEGRLATLHEGNLDHLTEQNRLLVSWDVALTIFRRRLAETIAWCGPSEDRLRTRDLERPSLGWFLRGEPWRRVLPRTTWRQFVVEALARKRAELLGQRRGLAEGRLLLFDPDSTTSDGAAEAESHGFFDVDNIPAWDTWVCYVQDGHPRGRSIYPFSGWLVSWVPQQLADAVSNGIRVNPEQCIAWASDVDTLFTRKLREAALL